MDPFFRLSKPVLGHVLLDIHSPIQTLKEPFGVRLWDGISRRWQGGGGSRGLSWLPDNATSIQETRVYTPRETESLVFRLSLAESNVSAGLKERKPGACLFEMLKGSLVR